jgi:hypothetical protein
MNGMFCGMFVQTQIITNREKIRANCERAFELCAILCLFFNVLSFLSFAFALRFVLILSSSKQSNGKWKGENEEGSYLLM